MRISGNAAVVTGGASGLGAATVARLADLGAQVFALDLPQALAKAPACSGVTYLAADVTDQEQVGAAVKQAASGDTPLRIVVNCAGVDRSGRILGEHGPHDLDLFRHVIEVNLTGTFTVMALAAAMMAQTSPLVDGVRGVIVNTASTFAFEGQVGQAAYASAKSGVVGLTLPAARDLAQYGIRVLAISPGIFETPMLTSISQELKAAGLAEQVVKGFAGGPPLPKRYGRPDEFAAAVQSVVEQDYLNAEVIRLDGGLRVAFG
jgi:NAD(P)-dependent dehydrogenase (short-subunit alcohol dehydrogenase family)